MAAAEGESSTDKLGFDVVAVLPAGGCGVRMNLDLPKQFYRVMGRPLISYTLEAFESVPWIKEIVVPISENYLEVAKQVLDEFSHTKVRLTYGGSTRHRSIWNGIQALTADGRSPPTVVILHDVVRPFVDDQTLRSVTLAAKKHGAAGVIRPLASTVIAQSPDGLLDHSLDRSKFRSSEMPQAFQYEVIKKAYEKIELHRLSMEDPLVRLPLENPLVILGGSPGHDLTLRHFVREEGVDATMYIDKTCTEHDFEHGTECLHLAQTYGETRALLIDGPESLWKVTYKKDLYSVEGVLREKQVHTALVVGKGFPNFLDQLNEQLRNRDVAVSYFPDLSAEQQYSQTSAQQLVSKVSDQLSTCNYRVSVVFTVDETKSDSKPSSESCMPNDMRCFIQEISRRFEPGLVKGLRLVIVRFSNCRKNFNAFKLAISETKSCVQEQSVICFGVFVCSSLENQQGKADVLEKAAALTAGAMLDVPSVFNGQTFDTIT